MEYVFENDIKFSTGPYKMFDEIEKPNKIERPKSIKARNSFVISNNLSLTSSCIKKSPESESVPHICGDSSSFW